MPGPFNFAEIRQKFSKSRKVGEFWENFALFKGYLFLNIWSNVIWLLIRKLLSKINVIDFISYIYECNTSTNFERIALNICLMILSTNKKLLYNNEKYTVNENFLMEISIHIAWLCMT